MTTEEYKGLSLEQRAMVDFLADVKRELRRIADSLERLVAMEDQ